MKRAFLAGQYSVHPEADDNFETTSSELTYAKMFQTSPNETKILGVAWNKLTDKLSISISKFQLTVTKRITLSYMTSASDLLGAISPCHVLKKEFCDQKILCDAEAPEHLKNKFLKWVTHIEFK